MFRKKFNIEDVETLIGEGTFFKGVLESKGSVRIEGKFEGEIKTQGDILIGEKAIVKAQITARMATVSGQVTGNIAISNMLFITKTGKVYGNISGNQLSIEEGAIYKGLVHMDVLSSEKPLEGEVAFQPK